MSYQSLPDSSEVQSCKQTSLRRRSNLSKKMKRRSSKNDVLISAVISSYLLTHLHQVLQRAEYGAATKGHEAKAANFAQLRKVLCMDARSMEDASALGLKDVDFDKLNESNIEPKAA